MSLAAFPRSIAGLYLFSDARGLSENPPNPRQQMLKAVCGGWLRRILVFGKCLGRLSFSAVDANTVNRQATFRVAGGGDSGGCHSHVSGLFFRGTLLVLRPMYGLSIIRPIRP